MKFLIVCGGTGGHLSPGIAVDEMLVAHGHRCALVVSRKEVDSRLLQKYPHLEVRRLPGAAPGRSPVRLARFLGGLVAGYGQAVRWIREDPPDLVLAFGGFLSLGVGLAAARRRVPLALHEANRQPGRAIHFLRRFAERVYLPAGMTLPGLSPARIRHFGYPVRREFRRMDRRAARERLGLPVEGLLLVVIGGSQGAAPLNGWMDEQVRDLLREGVHVYGVRGPGKGAEGVLEERDEQGGLRTARMVSFCAEMNVLLSAADLAVSRAGAGSIAELTQCRLPSVLVPYPHSGDEHQMANARFLESQGGCVVLPQADIGRLREEIDALFERPELRDRMRTNLDRAIDANRKEDLVADLEGIAAAGSSREPRLPSGRSAG